MACQFICLRNMHISALNHSQIEQHNPTHSIDFCTICKPCCQQKKNQIMPQKLVTVRDRFPELCSNARLCMTYTLHYIYVICFILLQTFESDDADASYYYSFEAEPDGEMMDANEIKLEEKDEEATQKTEITSEGTCQL